MAVKMPVDTSCQALLEDYCTFSGWLRKAPVIKLLSWRKTYCVISDRCFYYFKNETSKKAAGKFPLYGFNKVKRNLDEDVKWSFVLEHVQPNQKSYKFTASSQQEMVEWMKHIKEEMLRANNMEPRTTADGSSDGSVCKLEELDKIEEKIYEDLQSCKLDDMPSWYNNDNSDSDLDDTDCDRQQGEEPVLQFQLPSLPERKPAEGQSMKKRVAYEDVEVLAGPSEHIPQIPKQNDYWKSIHFTGDKDDATRTIDRIAKDGVFLVRESDDPVAPLVLVVYSGVKKSPKKFKIFKDTEDSVTSYYMKKELSFDTLEELLYYYFYNSISMDSTLKLKQPYLLA